MSRITAPALTIGISSDILYPAYQQETIHAHITNGDPRNRYVEIDSDEGHDGFLIATQQVGGEVAAFLSGLD